MRRASITSVLLGCLLGPAPALSLAVALALPLVSGCGDKVSHDSLDEWMRTERGPGKLKKAIADGGIDADLSAHAAQNMIRMDKGEAVLEALGSLSSERRTAVLDKLVLRLWQDARIENEMSIPNAQQVGAKDALFDLRKLADGEVKTRIDGYLTEWLTGGYYDGRAKVGRYLGATVIRAIGASAGEKLVGAAKKVIAAPADAKGRRDKIEDELLVALAASGSSQAAQLLLDIYKMDRGDASLPGRALSALFRAYVDSGGQFDIQAPAALEPVLPDLIAIAKDESRSGRMTNDAVALISAVGMPKCLPPLLEMVSYPHRDQRYRYVGSDAALACGGVKAIVPVVEALPAAGNYEAGELKGAVWENIVKMSPRDAAQAAARELLGAKSAVSRWVAVEVLGAIGEPGDVARIRALAGDATRLSGYWGSDATKTAPTLGDRAAEAVRSLEGHAASSGK